LKKEFTGAKKETASVKAVDKIQPAEYKIPYEVMPGRAINRVVELI